MFPGRDDIQLDIYCQLQLYFKLSAEENYRYKSISRGKDVYRTKDGGIEFAYILLWRIQTAQELDL